MTTIPASAIVNVAPNVLAAGGSALDLNGLLLTTSAVVPLGSVVEFSTPELVADYFGEGTDEANLATVYFGGFDNSNVKPGAILFAQYNTDAVPAYLRGAALTGMTLAQLQALNELLEVTIDGSAESATINLGSATSFSNAAQLIQNALAIQGVQQAEITASIAGTTMTVTAVADGVLAVGQELTGTGVSAGTYINALLSGTGGVGTYTVSTSQSADSQTVEVFAPAVSYSATLNAFQINSGTAGDDSTVGYGSGAMATSLKLTEALGAVLSEGGDAAAPAAFMNGIVNQVQNWAGFAVIFNPDASGFANREAFANWTSGKNNRYAFVCPDADPTPAASVPATSSLGYALQEANYSGTVPVWAPTFAAAVEKCVFELGCFASVDFSQTNGRATMAFRSQTGLVADVTDNASAINLAGDPQGSGFGNGYNFYGAYATANDQFVFFNRGTVSGPFIWSDSFINQIWLNNAFQLALMNLLTSALSIPYNDQGRAQIEASLQPTIEAALNFGVFRPGVPLSQSQRSAVNTQAGVNIADTLQNRGWYLQILAATAEQRAARASPPCKFWYMDGQSVQAISLTSIQIQ